MSPSKIGPGIQYILSSLMSLPRIAGTSFQVSEQNLINKSFRLFYKGEFSASDRQGMEAMESVRKSLIQSTSVIPIMEHGTGSSVLPNSASKEGVSDVCRHMSKSENDCKFLYSFIKTLKPLHAIELGTCLGISASYIGSALVQNGSGSLATFEGSRGRAKIAADNIQSLGLDSIVKVIEGRFQDTLGVYLQDVENIDFAFVDGHHDGDATVGYFELLLPKFKNGGIIVFDDIFWSVGMYRAWRTIKKSGDVADSFEFKGMGIVQLLPQNQDQ